mmetsp:Transcript_58224/g.139740  ORF Transcript_58224/g.139740 Transcript_58224/m.139740 type:complete len:230 (+) Transcript_58224:365-1054(+)
MRGSRFALTVFHLLRHHLEHVHRAQHAPHRASRRPYRQGRAQVHALASRGCLGASATLYAHHGRSRWIGQRGSVVLDSTRLRLGTGTLLLPPCRAQPALQPSGLPARAPAHRQLAPERLHGGDAGGGGLLNLERADAPLRLLSCRLRRHQRLSHRPPLCRRGRPGPTNLRTMDATLLLRPHPGVGQRARLRLDTARAPPVRRALPALVRAPRRQARADRACASQAGDHD